MRVCYLLACPWHIAHLLAAPILLRRQLFIEVYKIGFLAEQGNMVLGLLPVVLNSLLHTLLVPKFAGWISNLKPRDRVTIIRLHQYSVPGEQQEKWLMLNSLQTTTYRHLNLLWCLAAKKSCASASCHRLPPVVVALLSIDYALDPKNEDATDAVPSYFTCPLS